MKFIIISLFDPIPGDVTYPIRYARIAEILAKRGHQVTYVTSSFAHLDKKTRSQTSWMGDESGNISLLFIRTPPYSKNAGIKRILNHLIFAFKLKTWLNNNLDKISPDMVLSAFPPLLSNVFTASCAASRKTLFVPDIQDLWPEAFHLITGRNFLIKMLLGPLAGAREKMLAKAGLVIASSSQYLGLTGMEDIKVKQVSFPLGIDFKVFNSHYDESWNKITKANNKKWMVYFGSSGYNSELNTVVDASELLEDWHIFIAGRFTPGPDLKSKIRNKKLDNVTLLGWMEYTDIINLLYHSDAGLLIVNPASFTVLPNKTFYYLAAGLPLISNLSPPEMAELSERGMMRTFQSGNAESLVEAIMSFNETTTETRNAIISFALDNFDAALIYSGYCDLLENTIQQHNT